MKLCKLPSLQLDSLRGLCGVALVLLVSCAGEGTNGATSRTSAPGAAGPIPSMVGFATLNGGTTGGEGGEAVTVASLAALNAAVADDAPRIVTVSGPIELAIGAWTYVGANKTIIGASGARLRYGGLRLDGRPRGASGGARNVIIKNVAFDDAVTPVPPGGTEQDNIEITDGATNVWIDHCTFSDDPGSDPDGTSHDGAIDVKRGSSFVTVSYCEFYNHNKTSLVGHDDDLTSDAGKLKVTWHHNWFNVTNQRHPRVRFGEVHVYNNYYLGVIQYGIGIGVGASIHSEANVFEGVRTPSRLFDSASLPGVMTDVGSVATGASGTILTRGTLSWSPRDYYPYAADPAEQVKSICMTYAGAGKPDRP